MYGYKEPTDNDLLESLTAHPELLKALKEAFTFTEIDMSTKIKLVYFITGLCPHCYETFGTCYCWRDD